MDLPAKENVAVSDALSLQQIIAVEMDQLKTHWVSVGSKKPAEDGLALVASALELALFACDHPHRDVKGTFANALKKLLNDPRLDQLTPSAKLVWDVLERDKNELVSKIPEQVVLAIDKKQLQWRKGDGLSGRVYKLMRRFVLTGRRGSSPILMSFAGRKRVKLILETHLAKTANDVAENGFVLSLMILQALCELWETCVDGLARKDDAQKIREDLQTRSRAALSAVLVQQQAAEEAIVQNCEILEFKIVDALIQVHAPWTLRRRSIPMWFWNFRAGLRQKTMDEPWRSYYRGALGHLDLSLEIASFQNQTAMYQGQWQKALSELFQTTLYEPLNWLLSRCEAEAEFLREVFQAQPHDAEAFATRIERLQMAIENRIASLVSAHAVQVLQPLERGRITASGQGSLALLTDSVTTLTEHLGNDCEIWIGDVPAWSIGKPVPVVKTLQIPVRELVLPHIEGETKKQLLDVQKQVSETYQHVFDTLQDIWNVIHFNGNAAISELKNNTDNHKQTLDTAEAMALGGLTRAAARIDDLIAEIHETSQTVDAQLRQAFEHVAVKVEKSLQPGGEFDMRFRRLAQVARSRAEGYAEFYKKYGAAVWLRVLGLKRQFEGIVTDVIAQGRKILGLSEVAQHEVQATMDEADMGTTRLERFPPIYRQLFRLDPLSTHDFLVGRNDELAIIEKALLRWESGRSCSLLIVGDVGTGKTSLLNCAVQQMFHRHPVYQHAFVNTVKTESELAHILCGLFEIPKTPLLSEVATHVLAREKPCVVLIEHGYELFLRCIGGLEVIKGFLQLVTITTPRVFWGLSMTEAAWHYLNAVVRISEFFSYTIGTRNMTREEIEQAIMVRHALSGYALRFLADDSPQMARRLKRATRERERQQVLRSIFFDQLSNASKGNVQIALFYWLRAIREIQNDVLVVGPLQILQFEFLNSLDTDKLFTLAALMQHGTLTVGEHMAIFRSSRIDSQNLLGVLIHRNVIQVVISPEDGETQYAVNPVMRRPVADVLWNRHIFY